MRMMMVSICLTLTFSAFAESNCKDENFNEIGIDYYSEIDDSGSFKTLFISDSPAPAGYPEVFGEGNSTCRAVKATYIQHIESKKRYVMFTTHDDYCDGGNTIGLVLDLNKYDNEGSKFSDAIVGEIGDSEFYCLKK